MYIGGLFSAEAHKKAEMNLKVIWALGFMKENETRCLDWSLLNFWVSCLGQ